MCAHYGDNTFIQLSSGVFTSIGNCDFDEIKVYKKVLKHVFSVSWLFISNYTDLMFTSIEPRLIR